MLKGEIISIFADKTGLSKKQAGLAFDVIGEVLNIAVGSGKLIKIPGLGTIKQAVSPPRKGIAPNGQAWNTPEKIIIKFKGK